MSESCSLRQRTAFTHQCQGCPTVQACCSSREQAHHLPVSSSKAKGICFWPSHTSATLHGTASQ
jgi:hypothetical protein